MKKIRFIIALMSIISLFLAGCSDDTAATATTAAADNSTTASSTTDTKNERTNTPAKSTVSTPSSMSASGSASSRSTTKAGDDSDFADDSKIYPMIKVVVAMMKDSISMADLNLMLVDARIASGNTASSTCYEKADYTITFSQAMYNSLVAQEEDFGGEEGAEGSMSASMKSMIGQEMDGPVAYKFQDIDAGGYAQEVLTGETCDTLKESFRWNTAKTKLASQFLDEMGDDTFTGTFTYNGDDNVSTFSIEMSGSMSLLMSLNMAVCSAAQAADMTGDCAVFSLSQKFAMDGMTMLMQADGKADDAGGYGVGYESFSMQGMNMSYGYKESFAGDGAVTGSSTCTSDCKSAGATWTVKGEMDTDYEETSYESGGENAATVSVSGVTADGSYILIETGKTPSANPEAEQGFGQINSGESFWDFWGPDKTTVLDVYKDNEDGTFTIQSGASVTIS
jgi:hypothetical protein